MLPLGAPAHAAPEEAPTAEIVHPHDDSVIDVDSEAYAEEQKAKMQREMDEAIALIEKMFDTSDLPPIDPARLTLAERTTAALIPNGSIEKMVDNLYGKMFKTFMGEFGGQRSEEHTSELQSLMRISYAVFCLKKKNKHTT